MPSAVATADSKTKELWRLRHKLRIRGDLLYLFEDIHRLVVPTTERKYLTQQIHCLVGHVGIAKVLSIARADYFWPGMEDDVRSQINSCLEFQLTKGKIPHNKASFQQTVVSEPFERIAIDIIGPLHQSSHGNKYVLAIVDYVSRCARHYPHRPRDKLWI